MVQQLALSPLALLAWGCFPELLVLRCSHFSSKLLSCFVAWPSIQIWVGHISIITRMYWVREITDIEWTSLHWISLDNRKRPLAHKGTSTCQVPLSPSLGCQQSKKEFINEIYLPPPLFLPLRKVTNEKSKCGSQVDMGFICDSGDRWGLCAQVCSSESSGLLCLPAWRWPLGKGSLPSLVWLSLLLRTGEWGRVCIPYLYLFISTWADSDSQTKALEVSTPLDSSQGLALSRTETKPNSFLCYSLFNCTQLLILGQSLSHPDLIYIRTRVWFPALWRSINKKK